MVSIDRAQELLDEIAEELPTEFFDGLNGGIILSNEAKVHSESVDDDLFILGEYEWDHFLGSIIILYYGSFKEVFGNMSETKIKKELRKTLLHEFTHHLEARGGVNELERKDRRYLNEYINKKLQKNKRSDGGFYGKDNPAKKTSKTNVLRKRYPANKSEL